MRHLQTLTASILGMVLLTAVPALGDVIADRCQAAQGMTAAGRYQDAARIYEEILAVDPDRTDALYGLGILCLRHLDRPEDAARCLRRHLELVPGLEVVRDWVTEAENVILFRRLEKECASLEPPTTAFDPASYLEAGEEGALAGDVLAGEADKAGAPSPAALSVITYRNFSGIVVAVEGNLVRIDLGRADGVEDGMQFSVYRNGTWIGLLRVSSLENKTALCDPMAGRREEYAWDFLPGDAVRQREDVLAANRAEEASTRRVLMDWQREEAELDRELKTLRNREKELLRGILQSGDPSTISRNVDEIKTLHYQFGSWKERAGRWVDKVLQEAEKRTAGNPHIASFRRRLQEERRLEEEEFAWQEIALQLQMDLVVSVANYTKYLARQGGKVGFPGGELLKERRQLEEAVKNRNVFPQVASRSKRSLDDRVDDYNKRVKKEFDNAVGRYTEQLHDFRRGTEERLAEITDLEIEIERWRGADHVLALRRDTAREDQAEGLLNLGQYQLLQGRYAKAIAVFRTLLRQSPEPRTEEVCREALDLALLQQLLAGEEHVLRGRGFAPPLATEWQVPAEALQGELRTDGDRVLGFFSRDGDTLLRAHRLSDGSVEWEFTFPGRLGGAWILSGGEVVFPTTEGRLYRLRVEDGSSLGYWSLPDGLPAGSRSEVHRRPAGLYWAIFPPEDEAGGRAGVRLFSLDFRDSDACGCAQAEWPVIEVAAEGVLFAGMRRPSPAWKGAGGMPLSFLAAFGTPGGVAGGQVPKGSLLTSLLPAGDFLAAGVIREAGENSEAESHVILLPLEASGGAKAFRVTFRGTEAGLAGLLRDGDNLFVLLHDGSMAAVDAAAGRVLWRVAGKAPTGVGPHFAEFLPAGPDQLAVISGRTAPPWSVLIVSREEGVVVASAFLDRDSEHRPVYADGFLYLVERNGSLSAFDVAREEVVWTLHGTAEEEIFIPAVLDRSIGRDGFRIASRADLSREAVRRFRSPGSSGVPSPLLLAGDLLLLYQEDGGMLRALAPASLEEDR